jgi:hypothetical protein
MFSYSVAVICKQLICFYFVIIDQAPSAKSLLAAGGAPHGRVIRPAHFMVYAHHLIFLNTIKYCRISFLYSKNIFGTAVSKKKSGE